MVLKRIAASFLGALLVLSLQLPAQKKKTEEAKKDKSAPVYIAPQVAAVIDADLPLRKGRSDIPLSYLQTLYLPAQNNQLYPVFLFQAKNADLNFAAAPETPEVLSASLHVFTRLYRLENGTLGPVVREGYVPFHLTEAKPDFQPEAVHYYSIAGDIYPAGKYLLAMAVSTPDFARITTCFNEFTLPDVGLLKGELGLTPVFSVRTLAQLPAAETKVAIHKDSFVYNTLVLGAWLGSEYKATESLDLFYCVLGATPDSTTSAFNIQHSYRFMKDGQEVIKLAPLTATSFIISQPVPFSFTEVTRDAKGNEKGRSEKLLEPGDYVLQIEALDNVSKAKALQEFKFKIVL